MSFQSDFQIFHGEIKKLGKLDQHNINGSKKFSVLRDQILTVLGASFGKTSREYRIVELTKSPVTVLKVMNHIAARSATLTCQSIAVNI
ncbi:hypothetical protein [Desulfitobacterium chlororespirans]|uniref:Uncharacterized protein n=1 Tax=Desulfitobacterium chlororespirans DSM 11544 TaxID=1121395 RepID=A0A1M7UZP6_9FIRM|nr:hypothetical protein [Desulfitobacterium chlororespirans]SHN88396.1 hypothetical protein SAMN02745215_05313 [Desulfitobacterium chlororespirans DSM 11544]